MKVPKNLLKNFYKKMILIRRTEENLLDLFYKGKIYGTTRNAIRQGFEFI